MNYTENYQLPQWEDSDRLLREDFNDAMAKVDKTFGKKAEVITGTYTGDGESEQFISLAIMQTPLAVFVCREDGLTVDPVNPSYYYGGMALQTAPLCFNGENILEAVVGGFKVFCATVNNQKILSNGVDTIFHYIAFVSQ